MPNDATPVFRPSAGEKTPATKLLFVLLIGFLLSIPLFTVYLLNWDRQSQSETARTSIAEGWGGPQTLAGPVLVIPYQGTTTETVEEGGKQVTRTRSVLRELVLAPETLKLDTELAPKPRRRSIYTAVVYEATNTGSASFALPPDIARFGVTAEALQLDRAELRFGLSDARGLFGPPPSLQIDGKAMRLEPGKGLPATGGAGFYAALDAISLRTAPLAASFSFAIRGNAMMTLTPRAGDTQWSVKSPWPNPSFKGGFLPLKPVVSDKGFEASYRIGNLALGQSLVDAQDAVPVERTGNPSRIASSTPAGDYEARIELIDPVNLYDQVERATKYGFLFIGFTFLAFLMFDVIGGVRVSSVEYLLVGAALILFFVLLLAFAEVIGFTWAYLVASAGIIGMVTAYSAAVLKSWRRASYVGGLLTALYAVLYILLSLEAYSLLIGSLMLFAALALVMYFTRRIDWGSKRGEANAEVLA